MKKQINFIISFLALGLFSGLLGHVTCYLLLDKLECHSALSWLCKGWDQFEYWIAHKSFSLIYYWVGLNGFVGSVLWMLEEKYLDGWIKKSLGMTSSIFGIGVSGIAAMLLVNCLGHLLYLYEFFELLYNLPSILTNV